MAGVYELVLGGVDINGFFAESVYHFNHPESGSGDPYLWAQDLAASFLAQFLATLSPCVGNDSAFNLCHAKKVSGTGGVTVYVPVLALGTHANTSGPFTLAADIAFFPGGALNRAGHTFVWGVPNGVWTTGAWLGAYITVLNNWADKLISALTLTLGGSAQYGTYTRKTKTCTTPTHRLVRIRPTGLNKRTRPLV